MNLSQFSSAAIELFRHLTYVIDPGEHDDQYPEFDDSAWDLARQMIAEAQERLATA